MTSLWDEGGAEGPSEGVDGELSACARCDDASRRRVMHVCSVCVHMTAGTGWKRVDAMRSTGDASKLFSSMSRVLERGDDDMKL